MLSLFTPQTCTASNPTLVHLERKLERYVRRTQKPNARRSDYITRDRLAVQLTEAKTYLC